MDHVATSPSARACAAAGWVLLIAAPLLAGAWMGFPPGFFRFPPVLIHQVPAPGFSAAFFSVLALMALLVAAWLIVPSRFGFRTDTAGFAVAPVHHRFPAWLWLGLALNMLAWFAAWAQPAWLGFLRHYTFAPLWLGYVLVVDALVLFRTGRSRLHDSPAGFARLFAQSAVVWWYFEFINRFVRNWWYEGSEVFGWFSYTVFATLCFSTVVPALLETADLLHSFPGFARRYANGPRWRPWSQRGRVMAIVFGCAGLFILVRFPVETFPLTWVAPLAIAAPAVALAGRRTPFHDLARGNYTRLFALGLAALICGGFWEMWNFFALPKWHYAVAYVQVLHIFEMPLLGYLGYLPFGPLCWCMVELWNIAAGRSDDP